MSNLHRAVSAFAVLLFVGAGCAGSSQQPPPTTSLPAGYTRYTSQTKQWSIGYPSDWQKDESRVEKSGLVFFFSPKDKEEVSHANVNVNVASNVAAKSDNEILDTVKAQLTSAGAGDVAASVSSLPAGKAYTFSYSIVQEGVTLYGRQYGVLKNSNLFVLTFTGNKQGVEQYGKTFEDIAGTFSP